MVTLVQQDYLENKKLYDSIEKDLRKKLGANIPITQVGSTAIPDMYGMAWQISIVIFFDEEDLANKNHTSFIEVWKR